MMFMLLGGKHQSFQKKFENLKVLSFVILQ